MSGLRYGIASGTISAQPDFVATITAEGALTIRQSYKYLTGDWENVKSKFVKGTPIVDLYPQCEVAFQACVLDAFSPATERGGWTTIAVDFVGQWDADAEYEDRPVTYTRTVGMVTRSILEHPLYLSETSGGLEGIAAVHAGTGFRRRGVPPEIIEILDNITQQSIDYITDPVYIKWLKWVEKGLREYDAPTMEWTVSRTSNIKLSGSDFTNIGKEETPEGSPSSSPGMSWIYIGATEEIRSGLNQITKTWQERNIDDLPWSEIFGV
jgi:hypothetical protein